MDWLAELNDTIEMESWFEIQSSDAKELRDFILEKDAEIERLREALSKVDKALQVEAAEYVPAIRDAFDIISAALQQKDSK